jgi:hypothetical protein
MFGPALPVTAPSRPSALEGRFVDTPRACLRA